MDKYAVRVFLKKEGRAVYISHLDLLRTMQRALKRSGLPVWYSEGFNPRIYLNFPLPLSLGVIGEREPMDLYGVEEIPMEEFAKRLNEACPEGISVISAGKPLYKNKDIGSAEYRAAFSGDGVLLERAFGGFMNSEKIEVKKRSKKKGEVIVDIKPHIKVMGTAFEEGCFRTDIILPAGNELNINAGVFTGAFTEYCKSHGTETENICTKRTNIFCINGEKFI
ncbi:MAG: TIGR03936 family radical SAM-associated protein [Ruminococcus sp.]|nr:TIGR03936 family radical SAM-associated protein [Ruminococcus sp.]